MNINPNDLENKLDFKDGNLEDGIDNEEKTLDEDDNVKNIELKINKKNEIKYN